MLKKAKLSLLLIIVISLIIFVFPLCFTIFLCTFNAPLRNKMLEYYSNDSNYEKLDGIIVTMDNTVEPLLGIDILTENHEFPLNTDGYQNFIIIGDGDWMDDLKVGDEISFVSAPMYFYNGHQLPIVSLEKDGQMYLSFERGKEEYLQWIQETFD